MQVCKSSGSETGLGSIFWCCRTAGLWALGMNSKVAHLAFSFIRVRVCREEKSSRSGIAGYGST